MIVRHIPMKSIRQSSFTGLVRYITGEQGKQERLGKVHITNCQSLDVDWATHEVEATQSINQRAQGDKTYHLLISFPAGEIPSDSILKDIENKVCASLGFGEHQRISAQHYDTDNMHIHVGINKIHPTRHTLHEPFRAYKVLGDIATQLEIEHGLQRVNHVSKKVASENRAQDMEHHAGVQSLLSWIREACLTPIQGAQSWSQLHQILQNHGLEMRERSAGLIIIDGHGIAVKASSVSRDLSKSKLQMRFGSFEKKTGSLPSRRVLSMKKPGIGKIGQKPPTPHRNRLSSLNQLGFITLDGGQRYFPRPIHMKHNTDELFARYQDAQKNMSAARAAALAIARSRKNRLIEQAKRTNRLKRSAIKLLHGRDVNKKTLYALTSKALKSEIDDAKKAYLNERERIYTDYQTCAFADWLKLKALAGEGDALAALRSREARRALKGNVLTGQTQQGIRSTLDLPLDNITKTGVIIHRVGACAIRDDGDALNISRNSTEEGLKAALHMAIERFGSCITVNGSDEFKEQIAQLAARLKLTITFDDAVLEQRRQHFIQTSMTKEKNHDTIRQLNLKSRRRIGSGDENLGRGESSNVVNFAERARTREFYDRGINKPHLGSIGQQPPPASQNRLRNLSELSVVQFTRRSEVLLPSDVSRHLEHERAQSNNGLRRDLSGSGVINQAEVARDSYIAERELKRQTIKDILKHRPYQQGDEGLVKFAGIRQVEGHSLALLKQDEQIIVQPIDTATAQRMKRLKVGDSVTLTSKGLIVARGRSR